MADEIPVVRLGAHTYRLPFASLIRPLTGRERAALEESVRGQGRILARVVTYTSARWGARCVIDGANRLSIAAALDLDVPVQDRGPMGDLDAEAECLALNIDRRQLSAKDVQAARAARIARVAAAVGDGLSLRDIAAAEGVSHEQVRQDALAAVKGLTDEALRPIERTRKALRLLLRVQKEQSVGSLPEVLAGPHADALRRLAAAHGVPLSGDRWPAVEALVAVVGELAAEAAQGGTGNG